MTKNKKKSRIRINVEDQMYKGITLRCINRRDYDCYRAKRFTINHTNQNVWIPNKHLLEDGTIKGGEDIDYIFLKAKRECEIAGVASQRYQLVKRYYSRYRTYRR